MSKRNGSQLGGERHLVDHRPGVVVLAQAVGRAVPERGRELSEERGGQGEYPLLLEPRGDDEQAVRVLRLGAALLAHAEKRSQFLVGDALDEPHLPSQPGGGDSQRPDRVPGVVLAVPEGALAVLPGLAPVDGGEPEQQRARRQRRGELGPGIVAQLGAQLERVLARRIMVDGGPLVQPGDRARDQVTLGRVQVAARGVHPQRPARLAGLLPRRKRERVVQELRDRAAVERRRWDAAEEEGGLVARLVPHRHQVERQQRRIREDRKSVV